VLSLSPAQRIILNFKFYKTKRTPVMIQVICFAKLNIGSDENELIKYASQWNIKGAFVLLRLTLVQQEIIT
jgi:hypothetical protein